MINRLIGKTLPRHSFRKAKRKGYVAAFFGKTWYDNPYGVEFLEEVNTIRGYLARAWKQGFKLYASGFLWKTNKYLPDIKKWTI